MLMCGNAEDAKKDDSHIFTVADYGCSQGLNSYDIDRWSKDVLG